MVPPSYCGRSACVAHASQMTNVPLQACLKGWNLHAEDIWEACERPTQLLLPVMRCSVTACALVAHIAGQ